MEVSMPKPKLFISYRRSDAIDAVRALYFQLRLRFGLSQVFMDVSAIGSGDVWPQRLKLALQDASVVLVVIGPTWLKSADEYGRRRLDTDTDWVRKEVESALSEGKSAIPLLIGGLRQMPPAEALPTALAGLLDRQQHVLDNAQWDNDVESLTKILIDRYGFRLIDQNVVYPLPQKADELPLTEEALFSALQSLPGWEPVESFIPRDYPRSRHELRRGLRFGKFRHAIQFLQLLVEPLNRMNHHPRIENQWRNVFIHFTTWDVGNRITALDVEAARIVEAAYKQFNDSLLGEEKR
jgi:pterin-4a-carbinolamine dehydratase